MTISQLSINLAAIAVIAAIRRSEAACDEAVLLTALMEEVSPPDPAKGEASPRSTLSSISTVLNEMGCQMEMGVISSLGEFVQESDGPTVLPFPTKPVKV